MTRRGICALSSLTLALAVAMLLQGCLLVRITEHRIKLNDNGSGEGYMRLTDIRSDGATDSARIRDFGVMMASVEMEDTRDFERNGRKVMSKQFSVSGDTLSGELTYSFPTTEAIDGLKTKDEELFVVVPENREILKTNGKIKSWERSAVRIVWPKDAKRLMYQIREKSLPPSTSLATLYVRYMQRTPGGKR